MIKKTSRRILIYISSFKVMHKIAPFIKRKWTKLKDSFGKLKDKWYGIEVYESVKSTDSKTKEKRKEEKIRSERPGARIGQLDSDARKLKKRLEREKNQKNP